MKNPNKPFLVIFPHKKKLSYLTNYLNNLKTNCGKLYNTLINVITDPKLSMIMDTQNVESRMYILDVLYPSYIHLSVEQMYNFINSSSPPNDILNIELKKILKTHFREYYYYDYTTNYINEFNTYNYTLYGFDDEGLFNKLEVNKDKHGMILDEDSVYNEQFYEKTNNNNYRIILIEKSYVENLI